ncbi:pentatricopeptide repeat-containing protein At3g62890-like [Magnolia sinica]|uniref:pentatricopeptide repeat-containing protein At3g62890-like n=1 Tax=Magnolia sinica TaxID=86752 RepID=UPI0026596394|nr:pentatricopeptide repeat-containing protein At3g62890-like [Magnolia sinica]
MLRSPATPPNKFTFTFLLKSCLKNSAPHFVKHIHCHLTLFGFASDPFLQTALVSLYADTGLIEMARHVFDKMPHRDIVSYTALVSAYASCGLVDAARQAFDEMPERNAVSWGAVIAAYSQSGQHVEALALFRDMQRVAGVDPTEATLVSVLSSAAHVSALKEGDWVHRYIWRNRIPLTASLGTALLTMYAKCGSIVDAMNVFDEMPQRDAPAWTAMILALATHGQCNQALHFFNRMVSLGFRPDRVTFIGVLTACSHGGFLDTGRYHFACMKDFYNIAPGVEHYGCMVDILGRTGHVEEAWNLVQAMPVEPDTLVLKGLLSACSNHGYVSFAEWTFKKLIALDASNASPYVMLANTFASVGKWSNAEGVRKMMRDRGVAKTAGCSLIELDGVVHQFVAGDNEDHPEIEVIRAMLHGMGQVLIDGHGEHV